MKRVLFVLICGLASVLLIAGCGSYQLEEETEGGEAGGEEAPAEASVVLTLDNPDDFPSLYPLMLYLFDSSGQCIYESEIGVETDMPVISQPHGTYVMSVFSGLSSGEYAFPMELHPRQLLTFTENGCAGVPLVAAKSHIQLNGDIRVALRLFYAVACVSFTFDYFPESVTEVTACLSPVSSGISLGGDVRNDDQYAVISCSRSGLRWESGPVYVIPSESGRIHLSLKVRDNSEEVVYGYDYNMSLEAGKVYRFVGNEKGGITVDAEEHQVGGWKPGAEVDVELEDSVLENPDDWEKPGTGGEGEHEPPFEEEEGGSENEKPDEEDGNEDPGGNVSGDTDVLYADELPVAESIWGPFFVWETEQLSPGSVKAILLAPRQWKVKRDEAIAFCESYEEDGLTGWRVLTLEEAKEFRDQYDENITELSEFLYDNGIDRFNKYDLRYLCNDCKTTFSFYNTRILDAGGTVEYGLRLFKEVIVVQN